MVILCLIIALSGSWLVLTLGLTYVDARRLKAGNARALRLALSAALYPLAYWYGERLQLLSPAQIACLQAQQAERLGQQQVDGLRCPLCGTEIQSAWVVDPSGRLAVRKGSVACPLCDFRLDSCRHCAHFKPDSGMMHHLDSSQGRCTFYKTLQAVEELCPPQVARQLRRGHSHLLGPTRIVDSYLPLDGCSAFVLDKHRLRTNGVRPPDRRRRGLLERIGDYEGVSCTDARDCLRP